MGGAIASMAVMKFKQNFINEFQSGQLDSDDIKLYTFGSPRFGNFDCAKYIDNNINNCVRFTNSKDYIHNTPSWGDGTIDIQVIIILV